MSEHGIPAAPMGSKAAGRRLWRAVLADYELDEHELLLLAQAARVADLCVELQRLVDEDGPLVGEPRRINPALVELRQQRLVLARLVVALRVPLGDQAEGMVRPQRRGVRGFYGVKGLVS